MSVRVFGLDLADPRTAREVVVANAVSKAFVMGAAAIFSIVSTRLIIGHFGVAVYAEYGLLVSIASLMPFADLGLGAAIMNAVAEAESPDARRVGRVLLSAIRLLSLSAVVIVGVGAVITVGGWWPRLLGDGLLPGGGLAALACAVLFALRLPLGVGQRLLNGLGLSHVQIRLQFLQAPLLLLSVLALMAVHGSGRWLAPLSYVGAMVVAAGSVWLARHRVGDNLRWAVARIGRVASVRGERTMHVAWPMLAQTMVLPIAFQSDRLLLSHLGTTQNLAEYNLGSQMFGMILQCMTAAAIALWPIFARARSRSEVRSPFRLSAAFGAGTLALALAMSALLPWIVPVISAGRISLSPWMLFAFVVFVLMEGIKYPLGMYMTDARGLRFQIIPILVLVPLNVAISWALIPTLGAAGPVMGSAVAVFLLQVIPYAWYVRRDIGARRAALIP